MRLAAAAVAVTFGLISVATPVQAHHSNPKGHPELARAAKKKKVAKKPAPKKPKTEKYMRAVPSR